MMKLRLLMIYLISLKFLDVFTTYLALSDGATEINPIVNYFIQSLGLIPALIGNFLIALVLIMIIAHCFSSGNKAQQNRGVFIFSLLSGFYTAVVLNNFLVLKILGE